MDFTHRKEPSPPIRKGPKHAHQKYMIVPTPKCVVLHRKNIERGLNETNIRNQLSTYASNLVNTIRSEYPVSGLAQNNVSSVVKTSAYVGIAAVGK